MCKDGTPAPPGGAPSPIVRPGDTIDFKYEGHVRATVESYDFIGGRVWLDAHALIEFKGPTTQVICVEKE